MMKLSLLFILVISMLGIEGASKCGTWSPLVFDPHCGVAFGCVYTGLTKADVQHESCKREEEGKPGFRFIQKGACKTSSTPCPRS